MTSHRRPALIVFGGLPGTGKTMVSRELAMRLAATHLRIDAIEQALRNAGLAVGAMGYAIGNALAAENLKLCGTVVADCVNPVLASRVGWRHTALQNAAHIVEIELVCSDLAVHRRRAEGRSPDISGLELPSWDTIVSRHYEPWDREHLVLDSADGSLDDLVEQAQAYVRGKVG
ncbi:AAA family ATPase [Bradyrhizobium sp. SSUT77]|uniref:AAA family ATPase n=1 Tax=Bradyrhizobium sp. SSUT77 TaxID=3040603 RepID=UPI00244B5DD9|nr:AAA family ATPase [Bradyrhizobium sp. SSUT77]MDH2341609.1 AAA family ATPase [Bradyrhizobium sp. SSUT77]